MDRFLFNLFTFVQDIFKNLNLEKKIEIWTSKVLLKIIYYRQRAKKTLNKYILNFFREN